MSSRRRPSFWSARAQWLRSPPENMRRRRGRSRADPGAARRVAEVIEIERPALGRPDELRRRHLARLQRSPRPRHSARRVGRWPPSSAGCRDPRYVRGMRTCSPTDRVTGRPDGGSPRRAGSRWRRRRPRGRRRRRAGPGLRYSSGLTWSMSAGTAAANSGMLGRLQAPPASTTHRHRHVPSSVTHLVAIRRGPHGGHRGPGHDRRVDRVGVRRMKSTISAPVMNPSGSSPSYARPGQPGLPVRREQRERVPPLRPPRVGDLAAFEHDVVDPADRTTACSSRDPLWPPANDHHGGPTVGTHRATFSHRSPLPRPRHVDLHCSGGPIMVSEGLLEPVEDGNTPRFSARKCSPSANSEAEVLERGRTLIDGHRDR